MRFCSIFTLFLLLVTVNAPAAVIGGPTVNPNNNHTYLLLDQSTWTDAEAEAISLGGHLVTVNDSVEEAWLLLTFSPNRDRHLWLGLNDEAQEGLFVWSSREISTYLGFPPGEPNNHGGNEDYVYIDVAHSDGWNDLSNKTQQVAPGGHYIPLHGVVEINSSAVSEPPVVLILMTGMLFILLYRMSLNKKIIPITAFDRVS